MVGLRVYFILSFVLSSFSRLCEYKSENNYVSRIENPLLTPPHFQGKIQTLQCGPWAPYDLATHPPGSCLPTRLCVCVLESPGDEPSGGPFPGPRGSSPSSGPWLRPVCVSVSTHPIVRWQNTALVPLGLTRIPLWGAGAVLFLCTQHPSQHLVPSRAEWKHVRGKRRAERRAGGETEWVPYWQQETVRVLLYPSSSSCISYWAFLCIYRWTKFWLRGPCSTFQGNLGKCQFCPYFFSSCLVFARLTLLSSLLPQPYFYFSVQLSPGYSTFIPYFKKKMTIFS